MLTIRGSAEGEIIIKKSRFLGFACRIDDEPHALAVISARKKLHYSASHNCFAYVLQSGIMRCSDDGEPQGTAGLPMLDVIKKSGLSDVLLVSTRYFGGTLLGAGGLARAYTNSAASALQAAQKIEVVSYNVFETQFSYTAWSKAQSLLQDSGFIIGSTHFSDNVHATLFALPDEEAALQTRVASVSLGKSSLIPKGIQKIEREI